jgi:hypothetical protein
MATSGTTTPSTNTSNWKIYVEWTRTGYNVDKLEMYINARLHLGYYTTTGVSNKTAYISINGTEKSTTLSAAQNWWKNGDSAPFAYRSTSSWLSFTIPMDENGNATISVSGRFPLNFYNISKGVYENPTTGPESWTLDQVETYNKSKGSTNSGSSWSNKYFYKTTDYGKTWTKCNGYKTTNSGSGWSKV